MFSQPEHDKHEQCVLCRLANRFYNVTCEVMYVFILGKPGSEQYAEVHTGTKSKKALSL